MGEWGCGKTSLVNLTLNYIENDKIFSAQNNLTLTFLKELEKIVDTAINKKYNSTFSYRRKYNMKKSLKKNFKKLRENLEFSMTVSNISQTVKFSGTYQNKEKRIGETLEEIKNEISKELSDLNSKIIIIIDDIDRLTDLEVKQIFKLVKSIADFKNIIYILCFDKQMVLKSLENEQTYSPEKYIEKIVQIPIDVPKIEKFALEECFKNELDRFLNNQDIELDFKQFLETRYYLNFFISNLRDVKRYINNLNFYFNILINEVNPYDFILILAIQIFENNVYKELQNNKLLFAGVYNENKNNNDESIKKDKISINEIISKREIFDFDTLQSILVYLFPKLNRIYGNINYGSEWKDGWHKELKICDEKTFDKYFTISIPENEISTSRLNLILESNDYQYLRNEFLNLNEEGKSKQLVQEIKWNINRIPKKNLSIFLNFILDIGDGITFKYIDFWENEEDYTTWIIHDLLDKLETQNERYKILKEFLPNCKSLLTVTNFIENEDQKHGKYGFKNEQSLPEEKQLFNDNQLRELEKLTVEKIHNWADNGRLLKCKKLNQILDDWSLWENPEKVKEFTNMTLKNKEKTIDLIKGFQKNRNTHTIGQHSTQTYITFDFEILEKFVNLKKLKKIVYEIKESRQNLDLTNRFLTELYDYNNKEV